MEFMLNNRVIITDLINSEVSNAAKKVQFVVSLDLYKERNENDNEEQAIEIFASSEMTTVYLDGLSNEDFFKMLNILLMFSSQGSGWILRKVNRLEIKIAAFAPVHASSYIALPCFLNGCRSLLIIRNLFDLNCFVYCFVAAYHIKNRINLQTEGRSGTEKTNPDTYKNGERQPVEDYQMPMPINRIPYFEDANDVRVNFFG